MLFIYLFLLFFYYFCYYVNVCLILISSGWPACTFCTINIIIVFLKKMFLFFYFFFNFIFVCLFVCLLWYCSSICTWISSVHVQTIVIIMIIIIIFYIWHNAGTGFVPFGILLCLWNLINKSEGKKKHSTDAIYVRIHTPALIVAYICHT